MVCALCVWVSSQASTSRLARQTLSRGRPSASAGAQVGTVSATIEPLTTGIVVVSGNWVVVPNHGVSGTSGLWPSTRPKYRSPDLSTVMPACEAPPRFSSKNACCFLPGLPRLIVHATIRPSRGTTNMFLVAPMRVW